MKSVIVTILIIFGCVFFNAQAQSYKINKQNYDYKMYLPQQGDPYNPTGMGARYIISGLGQILSGERGRGFAFMGATYMFYGSGIWLLSSTNAQSENGSMNDIFSYIFLRVMGVGLIFSGIVVNVWSIFDAVRVAKVNNMYFQDLRGDLSSVKVELNPFVDTSNYLGKTNASAGLTLKITF